MCIPQRSQTRGAHPSAESDSAVCIPPRSQAPWCASYRRVRNLPSVFLDLKFSIVISLWCLKILLWKLHCISHSAMCIIPQSQAPWCASHRGVKWPKFLQKLCGVHHMTESSSAVCIIPLSQASGCASHRGVKLCVCIIPRSQAPRYASHSGVTLHTAESESKISLVSGCF